MVNSHSLYDWICETHEALHHYVVGFFYGMIEMIYDEHFRTTLLFVFIVRYQTEK